MANFSLANSEIVRAVLQVAGLGRDAAKLDAATEADVRQIVRSGLRKFYFPLFQGATYSWRFLEKHAQFNVPAVFEAGTIAVAGGTVTLTGDVWPADIVNYLIRVEGHVLFVTERTDDTNIEVSNTQLAVDAGTTYAANKYRYDLPSDFGEWLGGLVYADGAGFQGSKILANSSDPELRMRYAVGQFESTKTSHYAITHTPDGTPTAIFWPIPRPDAFITGTYLSVPDDNLPADLTTPGSTIQVQPIYAEAVLEAILSAAEEYNNDAPGVHSQRFEEALPAAIRHDKAVGGHYDFSHRAVRYGLGHGDVLPIDFTDNTI